MKAQDKKKTSEEKKFKGSSAATKALPFNVQDFVDKRLKVVKTVDVPAPLKFPNDEADANSWSVSIVGKYLKSKLELPQYIEIFKRHEVDGQKLISLDEEHVSTGLEISNKLHALKISSHAQALRELVLEKAMVEKPKKVLDWNVAHLAAWLFYDKSCPQACNHVLKSKLNTYKLKDMSFNDISKTVVAIDSGERDLATSALGEVAKLASDEFAAEQTKTGQSADNKVEDLENGEDVLPESIQKLKKGKKAKTAIQRRREKAKATTTACDSEDEPELIVIDSSTTVPPSSAIHTAAYQSAMSSILTGVQHVSDSPADRYAAAAAPTRAALPTNDNAPVSAVHPSQATERDCARRVAALCAIPETPSDHSDEEEVAAAAGRKRPPHHKKQQDHGQADLSSIAAAASGDQNDDLLQVDVYAKSAERKKFLNKIAKLRKVVGDHAEHMEDLREQARILREENAAIRQQQKELLLQGRDSKDLILTLVHDRNVALQELEQVVALYDAHTEQERVRAAGELTTIAADTHHAHKEILAVWKQRNKELANLGTVDFSAPAGLSVPTAPVRAQPQFRPTGGRTVTMGDPDSSGSDLEDAPSVRTRKEKNARTQVEALVPAAAVTRMDAATAAAPSASAQRTITSKDLKGASSALLQAPTPQVDSPAPAVGKAMPAKEVAVPVVDLVRMLDSTADATHTLWQGVLRKYRHPRSHAADAFSDSRLLLRHIYVPWIKLGNQILDDAQSPDTPKDVRKALKGLERCARKAVLASVRRAKKLADGQGDGYPAPTASKKSVFDGTHTLSALALGSTAFGKKLTQSKLGSTAFPDGGQQEEGEAGDESTMATHVHRNHRAVGVVFGLALVQRLFSRYSSTDSEDKTQLLFLLNKVSHGDLPVTEISRDNLRDFLDSHIGLDLKWDKFDSVCQKLDPDRNGFISTASVTRAFEQLSPLVDRLPPVDATFTTLFLLSVATDTLSKPKLSINETLLSLILHNSKSSASFAKYIQKEQTRIEVEDAGFRAADVDPAALSPRSARATGDARVAEQQLFVSDVLYELSKEFVYKAYAAPDLSSRKLPASSKRELPASQHTFQRCKKEITYLTQHHQESCAAVARSLLVYDGASRKLLIAELSKLFLTFLRFRRRCVVKQMNMANSSSSDEFPAFGATLESPFPSPTKTGGSLFSNTMKSALSGAYQGDGVSSHVHGKHTTSSQEHQHQQLTREAVEKVLQRIDLNLATLTGVYQHDHEADTADGTFSPLKQKAKTPPVIHLPEDTTSFEEYERMLSELLGMPLVGCPLGGTHLATQHCAGLQSVQQRVEAVLARSLEHYALEEGLTKVEPEPPKPLASSLALRELQQTLYQELWQDTAPEDLPEAPLCETGTGRLRSALLSTTLRPDAPPIHVVEEVNLLMHKQRVEQCGQYLEVLNDKAAHRKKMIRSLMNLWQAAKASIVDRGRVPKFAGEGEIELKRLLAMPQEEIIAQTKSIQQLLVRDMQEPTGTKLDQLSQRINLLRQGMASQSIPDDDLAIAASLREVSALENALLQANTDAMRLASRIIKQLSAKKHVVTW